MDADRPPIVLCIAGSDCSGGAGIQADIRTCTRFGGYACTAITAVTAQNHRGVSTVEYVGDGMLASQLEAILDMMHPDAVKIGMIPNATAAEIVANAIKKHKLHNVVIDPVLGATSGGSLSGKTEETAEALGKYLFPISELVTPNLPESEYFLRLAEKMEWITAEEQRTGYSQSKQTEMGITLMQAYGLRNVLVKGGHSAPQNGIIDDILLSMQSDGKITWTSFPEEYIPTRHTHGTGCTLSSAIACGLAAGKSMTDSIRIAQRYVREAILNGNRCPLAEDNGPIYCL